MTVTVADMAGLMNRLAPPELAESWDNCGLQAGSYGWSADLVWVSLDPSYEVIAAACAAGVNLLITHHPLLLSGIKNIDFESMPGRAIRLAAEHRLSIFSAHTSLDSADGGLNDVCAERLELTETRVLASPRQPDYRKLAVFVPETHETVVLRALEDTPAGVYGAYSCCSFTVRGTGRFKPSAGASPFIGTAGEVATADEVRIETIVAADDLQGVIERIRSVHPYETMAYDVFPLAGSVGKARGMGRVGRMKTPMPLAAFADFVKERFGADHVRMAGDPDLTVASVAVCSGSGSSLMGDFFASGADAFVSGEFKHHNGLAAREAGRGLVDAGHFETERLVVGLLVRRLRELAAEAGLTPAIQGVEQEKSPFLRV
ncbi:MAG: Nif3-like dinuclear metal center hexameric protein [Thermodesulfobacteriota bacterium]